MYSSIGDYLIAEKETGIKANSFGLIVEAESVPRYRVVQPTLDYSDLKDKVIILQEEVNAIPLPDKKHVAIHYKHIIAVEM